MQVINILDAKTHFSKLVEAVSQGDEIVIARAGKPAARLVPINAKKTVRQPGALKGKLQIADCRLPMTSMPRCQVIFNRHLKAINEVTH